MGETDKETAEVMNCLLSLSKVQNNQFGEVQYWQNGESVNCDSEQIIWKLDSDGSVLQQVPVEFKMEKPVTYVVTQTVIKDEQSDHSKMVLIQGLPQDGAHYADLQLISNASYEGSNSVVEPEPSSSKTDSSYSESIDVEVDDLDNLEPLRQTYAIVPNVIDDSTSKGKRKVRKKSTPRKKNKKTSKRNLKTWSTTSHCTEESTPVNKKGRLKDDEFTKLEDNWQQVEKRFARGCECSSNNCFDGLNAEKVFRHHLNIADLTKAEHDMYLMGNILSSMQNPDETSRKKERLRMRTTYAFYGKKVCLTAFLYLEHVTLYHMKRLRKHVQNHGVTPRIHGNHGRKPSNTLPLDIYQHATQFVHSFIERHHVNSSVGSSEPGKSKVFAKNGCYRLPGDCTKKTLHDEYKSYCQKSMPMSKVMQYSTFTNFFKKQFPNVKFRKTDRCERKTDDNQDCGPDKARKSKKTKNKIMQTVKTVSESQTPVNHSVGIIGDQYSQYNSPYVVVHASQVVLNGDSPVILQSRGELSSQHFLANDLSD